MSKEEWASAVYAALAAHPDWAQVTVGAMQQGLLEALDRQKDRVSTLSWGLHQALSSTRKAKRRQRQKIIDAIEVSTLHPTVWSKAMIERETRDASRTDG